MQKSKIAFFELQYPGNLYLMTNEIHRRGRSKLLEMVQVNVQNFCRTFSPFDEFNFFGLSADAAYFILQVASLSAKSLQYFFSQISYSCYKLKVSQVLQL